MQEDNKFQLTDENGNMVDCEIIFTYRSDKFNKDYIVYTDHTIDEDGNLNVYASIYNPNIDDSDFEDIETEEEWNLIDELMDSLLEGNE